MPLVENSQYQYFLERCRAFDIKSYLDKHGTKYRESGKQLIFDQCPKCGRSKKFYINYETKQFQCFRANCRFGVGQNLAHFISEIEGIRYNIAFHRLLGKRVANLNCLSNDLVDPYRINGEPFEFKVLPEVMIPYGFYDFKVLDERNKEGYEYLSRRGISQRLAVFFDLRYCPIMKRVMFIVRQNGRVVGYQGRDITGRWKTDDQYPKALTSKGFQKSKALFNYDNVKDKKLITIVEGPVDAIKCRDINAVALFGCSFSEYQFHLLKELKQLRTVIVCLDADAKAHAIDIARVLAPFYNVYLINLPEGTDPGDYTLEQMVEYAKNACTYDFYRI